MPFIRSFVLTPFAIMSLAVICLTTQAFALTKLDEDLIYHSNFGTAEKIQSLLAAGANPNATGEDKWPAVSLATMRGDAEGEKIVHLLVAAGGDLNLRDANGETPLMNAISINSATLVKYMIEHGADFHAISTNGRNVKTFADHYGNKEVSALVSEAIRIERQRIEEGLSPKRLHRMMDDLIYYSCALHYIAYNKVQNIYPAAKLKIVDPQLSQVTAKLSNAEVELEHNFLVEKRTLESINQQVRQHIIDDLEALISTRNRIKLGVGTDADLDKRCKKILDYWRSSYQDYEDQGIMKDTSY